MKKKLILNKKVIATLDNPNRVFGGEGGVGHGPSDTCHTKCNQYSCGDTCNGATCDGVNTCPSCANDSKFPYGCDPGNQQTV